MENIDSLGGSCDNSDGLAPIIDLNGSGFYGTRGQVEVSSRPILYK